MAAKHKGESGPGRSNKIRFFYFEGDLGDTPLSDLSQVFANAMRQAPPPAPRIQSRSAPAAGTADSGADETDDEALNIDDLEEVEATPTPKAKASGTRKYPEAKVMDNVDLESDVSFPTFAASKKPSTLQDRYLIAAAWYKLHRDMGSISMHHVYTCFLHPRVKWPTSAADFDQPLRQLVKAKRLGRGDRGYYVINNIGLADVVALSRGTE